jgi:nucleoside-diphosphate-sugar epimerase
VLFFDLKPMKKVLVTGATGFVGTHFIPRLYEENWEIVTALREPLQLAELLQTASVVIGDICESTNWSTALQNVDTVVHLAARAHLLRDNAANPEAEFLRINTAGTENLARAAITAGVKHFVLVSSIGAMTTLSQDVLTEQSPCRPDTLYGRSKLKAEQRLIELAQNSSMTWTILRPTLVYGRGNPGNMDRLIKLVNSGLPIPLGSIHNHRSFIYVGNLVDAITCVMTHPKAKNQIFLCSDGHDLSTPELIRYIAHAGGHPCRLWPLPVSLLRVAGKLGDFAQNISGRSLSLNTEVLDRLLGSLSVDNHKLCADLDWHPPFSIEEGLKTLFD